MSRLVSALTGTPLPLFASVLGLGGLAVAWRRVLPEVGFLPQILFWAAAAVWLILAAGYTTRILRAPAAAQADLQHPIKVTFLSAITVGLILLATAGQTVIPPAAAAVIWWAGTLGNLVLMAVIMARWARPDQVQLGHVTPAWFIPVVGNILPMLAPAHQGMATFSLVVGVTFWVGFLPVILHRIFLAPADLPPKLLPTLFVLLAPPSILAVDAGLLGAPGWLQTALVYSATGFWLLILPRLRDIARLPFGLPHWAMSFPLAAHAAALTVVGPVPARVMLAVATAVIAWLVLRTAVEVARGRVFGAD